MSSVALVSMLQIASLLAASLAAAKLFKSGLYLHYRVLFAYLIFLVPNTAWPLLIDHKTATYFVCWISTEAVCMVFYVRLVLELFRLVLARFKGIYTLGRWFMYVGLAVAMAISALSLIPKLTAQMPQRSRMFGYFMAAERGIDLSLAIFILLILVFLAVFRVPAVRNVRVHAAVCSVYFLSSTLIFLLRSLFGLHMKDEVNLLLMATSCGCLVLWLFLLNPKGEVSVPLSGRVVNPWEEQRMLFHLSALNQNLLKTAKN